MDPANAARPADRAGAALPTGPADRAGAALRAGFAVPGPSAAKCRIREILGRIGDKWSLFVIFRLGDGPQRFTTLKRAVDGISQRMLTVTLRGLERDGIVSRTMYPVMPPRVDYALTPLGHTLLDAVGALMAWVDEHLPEVDAARDAYDARATDDGPPLPVPAPDGPQHILGGTYRPVLPGSLASLVPAEPHSTPQEAAVRIKPADTGKTEPIPDWHRSGG
jgi:DNA-binding HxlR family transcriptional regulator